MGAHAESRTFAPAGPALPDRYRPLRLIASGGTAHVWCAEDRSLTRRVAVKLLAEPFASDPGAVRRFAREARAAAHLSAHPHVVTIYDVGETRPEDGSNPAPFIVMEHMAGGTVADALRVGDISPDDSVRWLHEAASALDYAHAKGIVHRDIKPANLLLDRHSSLHVADFGIAQIGRDDSFTVAGQVLGTASYLAPERALGRPATVASDLYSLAVTWFELLAGERPFTAPTYLAQARQHLEQDPPRASEVNRRLPAALDAVMTRGMAKLPEDRWPSAQAFADAVSGALAPSAVPRTGRAAALSRGRRVTAAALAGYPIGAAAAQAAPTSATRRRPAVAVQARRPTTPPATRLSERRIAPGPLAGALVSLAAVVVGIAWIVSSSGTPHTAARTTAAAATRTTPVVHHAAVRHHAAAPRPKPKPKPVTHTTPAAPTPPPPPTADSLEAQGHSLLYGGQVQASIPVLQRAMSQASPTSLTYAYAEFDLGHALRLAGDPRAAVPLLVARLRIPNQTGVVKAELVLALHALARQTGAMPSGGAPVGPDHGRGHDKKHGHDHPAPAPGGPSSQD